MKVKAVNPEKIARNKIDKMLSSCCWVVQNYKAVDLSAGRGIALREVPLKSGPCDYLSICREKVQTVFGQLSPYCFDARRSRGFNSGEFAIIKSQSGLDSDKPGVRTRTNRATSLSIEAEDFDYAPFSQRGGLGKARQLFGEQLPELLDELNRVLAA